MDAPWITLFWLSPAGPDAMRAEGSRLKYRAFFSHFRSFVIHRDRERLVRGIERVRENGKTAAIPLPAVYERTLLVTLVLLRL